MIHKYSSKLQQIVIVAEIEPVIHITVQSL